MMNRLLETILTHSKTRNNFCVLCGAFNSYAIGEYIRKVHGTQVQIHQNNQIIYQSTMESEY